MNITEKVRISFGRELEVIKSEYFVDSNKLSVEQSKLAQQENNDCVVRAFMAALDIPYDQAHAWVKKELNRKDKTGTSLLVYSKNIIGKTKNSKKINFIGFHPSRAHWNSKVCGVENGKILANKKYKKPTGYTLKSFMETNPTGRFVLIVCGHALGLINGVLYGNDYECRWGLYRSIWYGFEIKDIKN